MSSSLSDKDGAWKQYARSVDGKSMFDRRAIAKDIIGTPVFWDWDRMLRLCLIESRI